MYKQINTYNIHIYAHVLDRKWIFLLIKQRKNNDKLCRHLCEPEKPSPPPGPPLLQSFHHTGNITKQRKTWEEQHYVLQRGKGM